MTVKKWLKLNPNYSTYTIKMGGKNYLCNLLEAVIYFGDKEVKKVSHLYNDPKLLMVSVK